MARATQTQPRAKRKAAKSRSRNSKASKRAAPRKRSTAVRVKRRGRRTRRNPFINNKYVRSAQARIERGAFDVGVKARRLGLKGLYRAQRSPGLVLGALAVGGAGYAAYRLLQKRRAAALRQASGGKAAAG